VDFELTDDQLELQRVVRDVAERECPSALVRAVIDGKDDDRALWRTYVGLDWPSLTVPEADGGMGLTAVELVVVLEELGRVADPTPFLATASQYTPLVRSCGEADQRAALLSAVCAGTPGAVAFAADEVRAERTREGWRLQGTARWVLDGDRADEIAVVAASPDGPRTFVVPAADAVATRSTTFDLTLHVAEVCFDGVVVADDRALPGDGPCIDRARNEAVAGLAAVTVGASQRVFELALGHIRERHQFGVPIGLFQSLKHMAVDVYLAIERARALCHFAGLTLAEDDPRQTLAASMAKAAAGDAQRIATRHGVQFFGGLGLTWENDLQLYFRRAKATDLLLGTAREHRMAAARTVLATIGTEVAG
jgi:alkylation response protein AidB-like acyl-CoA dehydrogenase